MLDANLGTIGVWLAFDTSVVGAITIAVGLVRQRNLPQRLHVRVAPASLQFLG